MGAISIGIENVRTKIERVVAIDEAGKTIVRWGLVVVLVWIGGMKFTAYEAMGIQPLVAHSPLSAGCMISSACAIFRGCWG